MAPGILRQEANETSTNGYVPESARKDVQPKTFPEAEHHSLVLASFRCLVADLVQQFNGGHPGYDLLFIQYEAIELIHGQKGCYGDGSYWDRLVEICYEIFSVESTVVQSRPLCTLQWPLLRVPVHVLAFDGLQVHDI